MMKKNIKRVVFIIIALCWMGVIFYFSSQTGTTSSRFSGRITQWVVDIFFPKFSTFSQEEQASILKNASFLIRKLAHYSEYAILGFFLFSAVWVFTSNQKIVFLISGVVGILYAISDEFHQSFVSGRTPMIKDIFIDSIGLCSMLLFLGILWNIIETKRKGKLYD